MDGGWDLGTVINDIMGFGRRSPSTANGHWPWRDAPPVLLDSAEDHELHHIYHPSFSSLHSINDATLSTWHIAYHDFIPTTTDGNGYPFMDGNWISHSADRINGSPGHTLAALENGMAPTDRKADKIDGPERASSSSSLRDQLIMRFNSEKKREIQLMEYKKRNLRRMKDEIVMMVEMFAVLMGVFYLGVAATTNLTCRDFWGPALLAAAITIGTVHYVIVQLPKIDDLQREVESLRISIDGLKGAIASVRKGVEDVNVCLTLYNEKKEKEMVEEEEEILEGVHTSAVKRLLTIMFFVTFTFVLLLSCIKMLCP